MVENMNEGDILNESNLRIIRPGSGLHPRNLENFLGRKVVKKIKKGTPLSWDLI